MIFIDSRIGSKELMPYIPSAIPHTLTTLEYADVAWMGNGPDGLQTAWIGVERKRLRDLLSSMESGRLVNHQLAGMANAYHVSYVVVEGIWRAGKTGLVEIPIGGRKWGALTLGSRTFTTSSIDNFANALMCLLAIKVVFTPSLERTASWISNVYRWWTTKRWHQHQSCSGIAGTGTAPLPASPMGKAPLVARVAKEVTGVGVDRAMKLSKVYGSVHQMCHASVKELMKVDGVGKTTAEGIRRELNDEKRL